jgi:four helix bundle protein
MAQIKSFRDLNVFKLARTQSRTIFEISKSFPKEERFSLTDQIRRSSRAVNAMVAEAWARRLYVASFTHKLDEALGEAMETQAWLDHCLDCDYITTVQHRQLDAAWQSIGAMLYGMMEKAEIFCPKPPR